MPSILKLPHTTWLSEDELALLFDTSRSNIGAHIKVIYADEELEKSTTLKKFLKVGDNSKKYYINHYNLDMIIAVGYKVKSKTATRFRKWATNIIREHITSGNYASLAQEEALRLLTRVQVDDGTEKLIGVATTKHRVRDENQFLDAGSKGLYNASVDDVEGSRKIPNGKLYDYIGSAELGMHVFRLTQTAEALSYHARQGDIKNPWQNTYFQHNRLSEWSNPLARSRSRSYSCNSPLYLRSSRLPQIHRHQAPAPALPGNNRPGYYSSFANSSSCSSVQASPSSLTLAGCASARSRALARHLSLHSWCLILVRGIIGSPHSTPGSRSYLRHDRAA